MYIHGIQIDETNYDPSGDWDINWQSQLAGETFEVESNVPGGPNDKTDFDHVRKFNYAGSYLQVTLPYHDESTSRYHTEIYYPSGDGDALRIWTDPT